MSDELKNKSGKVKVMYVRSDDDSDKRTHNPRTGKGGRSSEENLVLTAAAALRVTNETAAATIANVTTVSVTIANAMIFIATMRLRGVPFPALPGDETPVKRRSRRDQREELYRSGSAASSACGRDPRIWRKRLPGAVPEPSGSYRSRLGLFRA